MKKKIRTTSFWLELSGAVGIMLETISSVLKLELYSKEVEAIILAICSVFVVLGVITKKDVNDEKESSSEELLEEINKDNREEK